MPDNKKARIVVGLLVGLCVPWTAAVALGAASARQVENKVVLENEMLRVVIDPQVGARVSEYVFKPFGDQNLCFSAEANGGMMMDMFWQQTWPGEFLKHPYQFEIVKAGPDEAVVRVWRMSTGVTGNQLQEMLSGILMQRTISLRAGDRALHCRVSLQNTTQAGKIVGYWIQNNFYLLSRKEANQWYRPTPRGVDLISTTAPSPFYWFFVDAPTGGWVGVGNAELNGGMMLLMDYNELWRLYTNMGAVTTEWMYDRVAIPPGKAWETDVVLIPTPGLSGYACGSQHVIAQMQVAETPGGLRVTHTLTQGVAGLSDVTLTTRARGVRTPWQSPDAVSRLEKIDMEARKVEAQLSGVQALPAVIEVQVSGTTAEGKKVELSYGDYYGGSAGINKDMVTLEPLYAFPRPPKQKVFLKPDKIVKANNDHLRVLFVRGLWYNYTGVDAALKGIAGAEVVDCWYGQSDVGFSLSDFPPDYATLMGYDVIILANVDGGSLGGVGQEMLADFIEAGGGILMLGGDRTYGQGEFDNARFAATLPVKLHGPFDWRKLGKPAQLRAGDKSPITDGVSFKAPALVLYRHILEPADGATVAVRADDFPALVTAARGKGRVAAALALPFGEPQPPQAAYWESADWQAVLRNTVLWLSGK